MVEVVKREKLIQVSIEKKTSISAKLHLGQMHLKWFKTFRFEENAISENENETKVTSSFLIEINSFERAGVITGEFGD